MDRPVQNTSFTSQIVEPTQEEKRKQQKLLFNFTKVDSQAELESHGREKRHIDLSRSLSQIIAQLNEKPLCPLISNKLGKSI